MKYHLITLLAAGMALSPTQAYPTKGLVDYSDSEDSSNDSESDSDDTKNNTRATLSAPTTVLKDLSPARRERKISSKSPLTGTPADKLHLKNKLTPGRLTLSASLEKQERKDRITISQKTATALLNSIHQRHRGINDKLQRQGVLIVNKRVIDELSEQLIADITEARANKTYDKSMLKRDRLIHALSMEMIVNAILYGRCSVQYAGKKEQLVINASVKCSSNDTDINEWITAHSEIKLVFGYPPDCTNDSNDPFVLFHAMIHNPDVGRHYNTSAVESVEAFLAQTAFADEPILHFRIHHKKKPRLPGANELFATVNPSL